jgi:hypothetical protein
MFLSAENGTDFDLVSAGLERIGRGVGNASEKPLEPAVDAVHVTIP